MLTVELSFHCEILHQCVVQLVPLSAFNHNAILVVIVSFKPIHAKYGVFVLPLILVNEPQTTRSPVTSLPIANTAVDAENGILTLASTLPCENNFTT